jgi:uncharacterized repeat protein (TIGR01451 family)
MKNPTTIFSRRTTSVTASVHASRLRPLALVAFLVARVAWVGSQTRFLTLPPTIHAEIRPTETKRTGVILGGQPTHLSKPTRGFLRGLLVLILAIGSLIALSTQAQSNYPAPYYFNTFAGNAYGGNGTGSQAIFSYPYATAVDGAGNVYVADTYNYTVRKITPAGVVTTLAGLAGEDGSTDGMGSDARFSYLFGIAADSVGNVYVTDFSNTIRKITPAGVVTTLAGTPGVHGSADGTGSGAQFWQPWGIAVDSAGNVYVADQANSTIRKITPAGAVSTIAGAAAVAGSADGSGTAARFNSPAGIAVDSAGNLYVADTYNQTLRKITSAGVVTTLAGTAGAIGSADGTGNAARFNYPNGLTVIGSTVYVADTYNMTIRKVTSAGVVTTFAGAAGVYGSANGTGSAARLNSPYGVAATSTGTIYVADAGNNEIRKITPARAVTTFAGSATMDSGGIGSIDGTGRTARFNYPNGVAVAGTTVYVGDTYNHTIRKITSNGVVTIFAGTAGVPGSADGTGSAGQFNYPFGVTADKSGNVYVADYLNSTIRRITSAGVVTTLAGTAGVIGSADGTGSAAQFFYPFAVAVDGSGNVYVADTNNNAVRKITPAGVVTTLAGLVGNHDPYTDGTGSNARFGNLFGIAADSAGNVYVADNTYSTVRKITPAGLVTTLAGSPGISGSADGTGSAARFSSPRGITVDSAKNLYVTDQNNQTIRKITPAGVVTTVGGVAGSYGIADGTGRSARFFNPAGIAVASSGTIYVADSYNHEIRSGVLADLKITCTDNKTTVAAGSLNTYTITVTNTGLENLNGAVVSDTFPAQLQNVSYTATGKSGATGFSAGSGNISQSVNLPPNSSVTYKATGSINGNSGTVISNTASVSVPAGVSDPNTANNTATDKDTIQ